MEDKCEYPQDASEVEWVATVGNWGVVRWNEGIFPPVGAKLFALFPPKKIESLREEKAKLNAAAPDLLEALDNLLKVHEGEGGTRYPAADIARAAIAKAKGEDQ